MNQMHYEPYKRLIKFIQAFSLVIVEAAIYGAVWYGYYNQVIEFPFWRRGNWLMVALYSGFLFFFFHTYGAFRVGVLKKGNLICSQILSLIFVNGITYIQITLLDKRFHSLWVIAIMTVAEILAAVLWTIISLRMYRHMFPARRLLLVYGERPVFHLMEKIDSREDKYYLASAVSVQLGPEKIMAEARNYDAVIIGDIPAKERNTLLKRCFEESVRTYTVPKISDILIRSSEELNIFDSPLLLSRNISLHRDQELLKRFMDLLASGLGLLITSPFFALISLAIYLSDPGPVFYRQIRLTKDGKKFEIYKFRTMVQDAEANGKALLASENDPRILPVGKFLRRCRLDELPQLLNIWRGDMSLVGPRPERPELAEEIEKTIPEFRYRLKVKAGLTGYAQVYGKYNTTAYDKLKLDLNYIQNYSFLLDLKLILMTPKVMLLKESTEGVKQDG